MKIKSWTSNEVELRHKMVCRYVCGDIDVIGEIIDIFSNGFSIFPEDQEEQYSTDTTTLTMLHCRFQDGDRVNVYIKGNNLMDTEWCDAYGESPGSIPSKVEFVNPDLRTSPDYEVGL